MDAASPLRTLTPTFGPLSLGNTSPGAPARRRQNAHLMVGSPARRHIVVLSQFYPPEAAAASNRVAAISRALAAAGNKVTVITGLPSFPDGVIPEAFRYRGCRSTADGDVGVDRVWTLASGRLRTVDRLRNWLSVAAGATLRVLFRREPIDVVLVSSPPITLALPALVASAVKGAQLIVDVRDVYPEVAIKLGIWKRNGALARLVGLIADALHRHATLILTVTETCKAEIAARGVPAEKIVVAPNGFDHVMEGAHAPIEHAEGEFIVAYAGNMGLATGLEVVLEAALELRPQRRFRFVLIGGGAGADVIARRVASEHLENVTLLGTQPREVTAAVMRLADVCVVPLKRGVVDSLPTKLLDALSLGTPVIVCADGEAKEFVDRSGGGVSVPPENGHALAAAIDELAADPARRIALGRSGKSFVFANYERAKVVSDVVRRVASLPA